MFEKYSSKQEKKERGFSFRKLAVIASTALMCTGFFGNKVQAQSLTNEEVFSQAQNAAFKEKLKNKPLMVNAGSLLKQENTEEMNQELEKLNERLAKIKKLPALSVPEELPKATPNINAINGRFNNKVQGVYSKTDVRFLEKENYTKYPFTDIIVEHNSTTVTGGVQKITNEVTQTIPTTDEVLTVGAFAALQNEDGDYEYLLGKSKEGYIGDGGVENTAIPKHPISRLNQPITSNFEQGEVVDDSIIEQVKEDGLAPRSLYNEAGLVNQIRVNQTFDNPVLSKAKEVEESFQIKKTNITKRIHSSETQTHIDEEVRSQTFNTNTETPGIQTALNLASVALPNSLKADLEESKVQHQERVQQAKQPEKSAKVYNMKKLEELNNLKNSLLGDVDQNIGKSKIITDKGKNEGSFIAAFVGTGEKHRKEIVVTQEEENKENFENVFTTGAEVDTSFDTQFVFNGEEINRDRDGSGSLQNRDFVFGLQATLDTQNYDTVVTRKEIIKRVDEPQAGIAAGIAHKDLTVAGKIGVGYDGDNNVVYPNAKIVAGLGNKRKANLQAELDLSTYPSINTPNEAKVEAKVPIKIFKKVKAVVSGSREFDLGNNDSSYKTRTSAGVDFVFDNRVGIGAQKTFRIGKNSYEGIAFSGFIRQNIGALLAVFYVQSTKLDDTSSYAVGLKAKLNKQITLDGSYTSYDGAGHLYDDNTVQLKFRYDH